ncbi:MAG: DUF2065 domain-containing protein [Deltaproteobacteria bacterium]
MEYFLCVIGMALIIEGLPYFAIPERLKEYFAKMQEQSDKHLRIIGLVTMVLGLVLIYLGRR